MTQPRGSVARSSKPAMASLIRRAAAGDLVAFTLLVREHRNLVLAVALAVVRDRELAEDVTQETFLAAFPSLPTLRDPAAFPAWLRRIARRQCARVLRRRRLPTQPLEVAGASATDIDPAQIVEDKETRNAAFGALWRIPAAQREVIALHYIEGMSQRRIAALLGLRVTTVNNRMHEGRVRLRHELLDAAGQALRSSQLPARFADRVGTILRIRGAVVDVRFEDADLPEVLETIELRGEAHRRQALLEVVQRRGHGIVRCLATPPERITLGMRESPREAIAALSPGRTGSASLLETGIKAIDLLCPIAAGGTVAITGDPGVGKLVLVQELARRLAEHRGGIGVFTFVRLAERPWARDVAAANAVLASGPDLTFFLATSERDEPHDPADLPVETLIHLSRSRAEHRIYPAIDPTRSWSRLLTTAHVGPRHVATARAVRGALGRLSEPFGSGGVPRDEGPARRPWMLQLYLSQPFYVSQPFTGMEGAWVPTRTTVAMCRQILDGRYDQTSPEAFWFVGARPREAGGATGAL